MTKHARYLIVDGHSLIFAWPALQKLHCRRTSLAREAVIKLLRHYQDWTGLRAIAVFDGKGSKVTSESEPGEIQIFYSRRGQTADAIIERLASKYGDRYQLLVATSDSLIRETANACGAETVSPEMLREMLREALGNRFDEIIGQAAPARAASRLRVTGSSRARS